MFFSELDRTTGGKVVQLKRDLPIQHLVIDSRKAIINESSIFFAIAGSRNDGHEYIRELYSIGMRQFVVERDVDFTEMPEANLLLVKSAVLALQDIVGAHRAQFKVPVIGITGSNGKTIVKEWLYQLLAPENKIVKNPASYNSQVGVPLSVWAMQAFHQLGIFEAGISMPDEMSQLEKVIQPTVGIFTNIGTAHDEGFHDLNQKIKEKLKLFVHSQVLLYCSDYSEIDVAVREQKIPAITWGKNGDIKIENENGAVRLSYKNKVFDFVTPFQDKASIENVFHCVALMLYFGYDPEVIQQRILELQSIPMRLELKEGISNCQVIDDTYNNDIGGLQISLDFLAGQQKKTKTLILSDVLQSGISVEEIADTVASMIKKAGVSKFIGIGEAIFSQQKKFSSIAFKSFYSTTEDFINNFDFNSFENETILVKGARVFLFEKIVNRLQRKVHGTVMQIDLGKMVHNLNFFKSKLKPNVKIMAMVKAFAYGSGSEEVANLLQYHHVDYLGVAYADEGYELRKKNIALPIMVMNPSEESFDLMISNKLEPAIYSLKMLKALEIFLNGHEMHVHVELETGMHRLGLNEMELTEALEILTRSKNIHVASVFSHLAGSDESIHDGFSREQFEQYQGSYEKISALGKKPLRHILNSAGILRLPGFQMDMVRLGIGLYGVDPTAENFSQLQPVASLKTVISQIKKIHKGESVGYGRKGMAEKELTIATIAIGYADGFSRGFSQGKGHVLVSGKIAPVIGNVCMDMTMIDITDISATEGDEVTIFGDGLSIHEVAQQIGTIPYEILTNTSSRVKRIFVSEGI